MIASFAAYPTRRRRSRRRSRPGGSSSSSSRRARSSSACAPAARARGVLHADRRRHAGRRGQGATDVRRPRVPPRDRAPRATTRSSARTAADRAGNLVYRRGARNLHPAVRDRRAGRRSPRWTRSSTSGAIDPECVVTPGIYVDRVVADGASARRRRGARALASLRARDPRRAAPGRRRRSRPT